ncbi:MAG: hypothetical protein IKX00_05380 [Bacilli bacterium]|nr:hypothetical protein [Bacilli bacterium]
MVHKSIQEISQIAGTHRDHEINFAEAESYFADIFNKVLNNASISQDEQVYLDVFMEKIYPRIGGSLYPYPRYDEKLKKIYQKASDYFLINLNKNTKGSIIFLWYFQMTQMSKENDMKPSLKVGHERFTKEPNVRAFYREEKTGIGYFPAVYFNPECIDSCLQNKENIIELLITSFHELEHARQTEMMDSEKLDNPQALIWAKENILRINVIGEAYYKINYSNIFHERDARYYSYFRANKMLEGKGRIITGIEEDAYNLDIQHKINENSSEVYAIDLLDTLSCEAIKKDPKLLDYYPVLKNIYNLDGTKKTLPQIESDLISRFQLESKSNPEINVDEKVQNLLKGICETDNDLQFQYLCYEASNYYANNNIDKFNLTVSNISKLLEKRELSYDEFEKKINNRIKQLEKQEYIIMHPEQGQKFDNNAYLKVRNELKNTKQLLKSAIEYNPKFKEEHNERVMKSNIKRQLSLKIKREIGDPYKYYATDKGYLQAVRMTPEEENERYRKEIESLLEANTREGVLDGEAFEKDIHDLNTYYGTGRK